MGSVFSVFLGVVFVFVGFLFASHGDSSMDYVSILFSSPLMHIVVMMMLPLHLFTEFAKCNWLSGLINDLARAIWRWTEKSCVCFVIRNTYATCTQHGVLHGHATL